MILGEGRFKEGKFKKGGINNQSHIPKPFHTPKGQNPKTVLSEATNKEITDEFHRRYYNDAKHTWWNTYYRGVRIAKYPTDLWVYQELIHKTKPDVIIECGTAYGGSAIFLRDMLNFINSYGIVITIDTDGELCRKTLNPNSVTHKCFNQSNIYFINEDSTTEEANQAIINIMVEQLCVDYDKKKVMVILDSDHSQEHVAKELEIYSEWVTPKQLLIVEDTNLNGNPVKPDYGNGPMEAVVDFILRNPNFKIDPSCEKFMFTANPDGFLLRLK